VIGNLFGLFFMLKIVLLQLILKINFTYNYYIFNTLCHLYSKTNILTGINRFAVFPQFKMQMWATCLLARVTYDGNGFT
jgi:hypothetical protein